MTNLNCGPMLIGVIAGLAQMAALVFLSHGPCRVESPLRRFLIGAVIVTAGWTAAILSLTQFDLLDMLASFFIVLTALLIGFTAWNLLAWGFTISLLATLQRLDRPVTFEEWVAEYTWGGNVTSFARDRLKILLGLGLARLEDGRVTMQPGLALPLAKTASWMRWFLEIKA